MAEKAAHAHDEHVASGRERFRDKIEQRMLAGRFDHQIRALHEFVQRDDARPRRECGCNRFGSLLVLIGDGNEIRVNAFGIESRRQRPPDRTYAENPYPKTDRCVHASSSMRSMARRALTAISGGTVICGDIVSSDCKTRSRVIVFMKAQMARGLMGMKFLSGNFLPS